MSGGNASSIAQANLDDIVLDVRTPAPNNAPTVTAGSTTASPASINRIGTGTTTLTGYFTDIDNPAVSTFTVSFRVREPDNATAVNVAVNSGNGQNGVTITSLGGSNYRATVNWDPATTATRGAYDLQFEVSDGIANASDLYTNNLNELTVYSLSAPSITSGVTAASPVTVDRMGTDSTRLSATWSDADNQPIDSFWVTFSVRKPDNTTQVLVVDSLRNGSGGLVVVDNGNGTYTGYVNWNPADGETVGLYDLRCRVFDGTTAAEDGYTSNLDQLTVESLSAPSMTAGVTTSSPITVNRIGTDSTRLSATWSDPDGQAISAYRVTFSVREPNNTTLVIVVDSSASGTNGLTIVDNGNGTYTATVDWNPSDVQTTGLYDLRCRVIDGAFAAEDGYTSNLDQLTVESLTSPTMTAGVTTSSPVTVNRIGTDSTRLSATWSDPDGQAISAYRVTFSVREPNNTTLVIVVDSSASGTNGLTIVNNGNGTYTATVDWNPSDAQTTGLYDLRCRVIDGVFAAEDGYASNLDQLTVESIAVNIPPSVTAGATGVSKAQVNRIGTDNVTISATFADVDQPGVGAFNCTFRIRQPNNSTELTLVNNQPNGFGGLTIVDNGGGSYSASYTYNPDDAQVIGLYDLYFAVSDGTDNIVDGYTGNLDELEIIDAPPNNPPAVVAGITQVSVSPVNRYGSNTSVISATFSDADQPGVGAFNCTFRIREPNNSTLLTLVSNQANGGGGLTIVDNGGGSYTASYTYDPGAAQALGFYDLYFSVSDGVDNAVDNYASNLDELEINEAIPPTPPTVASGATAVSVSPVNRLDANTTVISATFNDINQHPVTIFNCTFRIREPDNTTELTLVDNQPHGTGGLTITNNGGGSYTARYTYDPSDIQTLGFYDIYFSVTDGSTPAVDGFTNNSNELQITEVIVNAVPQITAGATQAVPSSLDRAGAGATTISAVFSDADNPGISAFNVTFLLLKPYNQGVDTLANGLQNGQGGLAVTSGGAGTYTASITWDPPANALVGYYDLYCRVSDGIDAATDDFADNPDALLVDNGGENSPPVVASDALFASPGGVERTGVNLTVLSATFADGDIPAVGVFRVSFRLREPDDATEVILATYAANGQSGVTITNQGSGIYTASVAWDPAVTDTLGYWDLYFAVSDGIDTAYDGYQNNLDELELYDAISNNAPTIVTDTTFALPVSVNRIGSEFTMLKSYFTDVDMPGPGAFTVTFRVRDAGSTEHTVVNAAHNAEQGLRILHRGGGTYEAAVLWDPDVADPTGTYDLYFQVADNDGASATDGYTANADELTVTSSAVLGDGFLLHRTNDSAACGGPNSACHNLPDHQAQGCRDCHTPHGTRNIYLVKDTIQTPNSGARAVDFRTLGIGDPYNSPDPTPGVFAGVMADSTDGVFSGVCEVCHTSTGHHRNDGSQVDSSHNDAKDCTTCHPHTAAFAVSGGGESSGGDGCSCHSAIANQMKDNTATSYHHLMLSENADYATSSRTCLMCHVHHDIFRPDLNAGFGTRARNLRVDITTSVVQGNANVLLNSDYRSIGTGGICLSCHTSVQTKSFTQKDGTTQTPALVKADFDAATATHNYNVTSTFATDGSTFNANCIKCHNDNMTKSYQSGTNKFSTHDGDYRNILSEAGIASPADPLEEKFCFKCHSTTSNPYAGTNKDYYNIKTMSATTLKIQSLYSYTYKHPTTTYSGRHEPIEVAADLDSTNRHAECADCHDPHSAQQGIHDGSTNLVSNALKGTWGVEPTSWPAKPVPTNNGNVWATPASFTKVDPAQREYQICLKCHSNYTTLPSGARNLAQEINPNYPSTHGIVQAGTNTYCNTTTMNAPWGTSKIAWCSDCHGSNTSTDPSGPHGSNLDHLLVATVTSDATNGTPLCNVCHRSTVYWSGSATASRYPDHPAGQGAHQLAKGCFSCHMWDFSGTAGLGVQTTDNLASGAIYVHGQNKKWVHNEISGAGSGQDVDAFVNGYIANMDYTNKQCWAQTCKSHAAKAY